MPACFDAPCRLFRRERLCRAEGRDGDYLFVFNYAETPACVRLDCAYINVLTGERVEMKKAANCILEKTIRRF